jgi:hypothetical protein
MLTAREVQAFLRQFEPLQTVVVDEASDIISAPHLVKLHGVVSIQGEIHAFETDLNLLEFGGAEDLIKLAGQLLRSFDVANRRGA